MIVYNFISPLVIAESIARETEHEITNLSDLHEWCFECLRLINAPQAFITKLRVDKLEDYRMRLPEDITGSGIRGIRTHITKVPLLPATDIYYLDNQLPETNVAYSSTVDTTDIPTGTFYLDNNGAPIVPNGYLFPTIASQSYDALIAGTIMPPSMVNTYTYKVDNGWIISSIKDDYIDIVYEAFPIDEYGLPLLPDDQSFLNALKYFIIERLDYRSWRKGKIADKVYQKSEQERVFYIAQASTKSKVPMTEDEYEVLKNISSRLVKHPNQHEQGFKTLNIAEDLKVSNKRINGYYNRF